MGYKLEKLNYHQLKTNVLHSAIRKSLYAFLRTAHGECKKQIKLKSSSKGEGFTPYMGH